MDQERDDVGRSEITKIEGDEKFEPQRAEMAPADTDTSDDTEKIKDQIENTRAQMGETIDAIQERLSFSNISEQVTEQVNNAVEMAKGAVYGATVGKAVNIMKNLGNEISASSIGKTVKNNPVPFLLIGAGAGLLAYQAYAGSGSGSSRKRDLSGRPDRQIGGGDESETGRLGSVTGAISGVKDSVTSAAGTAYDKVSGAVDQVYSKAGEYGGTAREQYDHYIEENPLAVGAVALALGAAVGLAIPATRYEGKLMGQAKRDLLNKAQDTATNLLHETRESVGDASRAFADKASSVQH